jgi:ABC-type cobalamin transport system permease subunit
MARVTAVIGLFVTLVAVPVVLFLLRRGEATLQRLLIVGVALGCRSQCISASWSGSP